MSPIQLQKPKIFFDKAKHVKVFGLKRPIPNDYPSGKEWTFEGNWSTKSQNISYPTFCRKSLHSFKILILMIDGLWASCLSFLFWMSWIYHCRGYIVTGIKFKHWGRVQTPWYCNRVCAFTGRHFWHVYDISPYILVTLDDWQRNFL